MLAAEKKIELYNCIKHQFPDPGLYRVSRICEWLCTNGYTLEKLGYGSFSEFAKDFSEVFECRGDGNEEYAEIKLWKTVEPDIKSTLLHPADDFFGTRDIILNDDIIEMTQQSLFALTKTLGNNYSIQQMKQEVYSKFDEAKLNRKLDILCDRYIFQLGYSYDGYLVNGIVTKNFRPYGKFLYFSFEKTSIFGGESRVKPVKPVIQIPEEEKDKLYRLLIQNFPCEQPIDMAKLSTFLIDSGVDKNKYNIAKMKDLIGQLEYAEIKPADSEGKLFTVTVHRKNGQGIEDGVTYPNAPSYHKEPTSSPKQEFVTDEKSIPTGSLTDFCYLPQKPMCILEKALSESGTELSIGEIMRDITEDFENARRNNSVFACETKISFKTRYFKEDGTNIELTLKPSAHDGKKWFLYYVDTACRTKKSIANPGKQLENFAFLGSWQNFLSELASKAVYEEWDFPGSRYRNYQILIQYIKYTFSRLVYEKKICISDNGQFAAFNTGLADNHYDDIYVCFVPNERNCDTKWKFTGFCTAASGMLGKQLVNYFNPLPQPPTYFTKREDLFYDTSKQLHTNFEHIIIDNIKRLPLQFLFDQFFDTPEAKDIVNKIRSCGYQNKSLREELYHQLKEIIMVNSRLFIRIQNRIKDSIELAVKRVRWNYKTAIPSYFPKRDTMSLMLPLALVDETKPDVALVVELMESGSYQGQTILTLPQAYIDARLMCRLTSDWLTLPQLASDGDYQEGQSTECHDLADGDDFAEEPD